MIPVILFRKSLEEESEFSCAQEIWGDNLLEYRSQVPENSIVICRYSALPFYKELEDELALKNSELINSFSAHKYIANMEWVNDLEDLTPKTRFQPWGLLPEGSYVVKGLTNSRKFQWKTHMFAETRNDVPNVVRRLLDDTMIREQGLVVRDYEQFEVLGDQINGLPVTNEWRFFCLFGEIISKGFYWSNFETTPEFEIESENLVREVLSRLPEKVRFVVVDVAKREDGVWRVVELNDGQMSGLSNNDPKVLYSKLLEG